MRSLLSFVPATSARHEATVASRLTKAVSHLALFLALLPLLVGFGFLLVGTYQRHQNYQSAKRYLLPLTMADIPHAPPADTAQDAGPLIRVAMEQRTEGFQAWTSAALRLVAGTERSGDDARFTEGLVQHRSSLELLEAATTRPRCDLNLNFSRGLDLNLTPLLIFRDGAALFCARALRQSDPKRAFADVRRAVQLGNLAAQTPCIVAAHAAKKAHALARQSHTLLVERFGKSPESERLLTALVPLPRADFFLRGEIVQSLGTVQRLKTGQLRLEGPHSLRAAQPLLLATWEAQLLKFWQEIHKEIRTYPADSPILAERLAHLETRWYGPENLNTVTSLLYLPNYLVILHNPSLRHLVEVTGSTETTISSSTSQRSVASAHGQPSA